MKNLFTIFVLNLSIFSFSSIQAQSSISSFSPESGPIGTSVTIAGSNFNENAENNFVYFGTSKALVTNASSSTLIVTVPAGANFRNISVTDLVTGLTSYSNRPFIVRYNNGNTIYDTKTDFAPGSSTSPMGIALNDFDGDGKVDMATTGTNNVAVFPNVSGTGPLDEAFFGSAINYATAASPQKITTGDLDADGKPEIVTSNWSGSLSVFHNTGSSGSISFAAKTDFALGGNTVYTSIGDIDGDGKPDLVSAIAGTNNISVLRNTSTTGVISFAAPVNFGAGSSPYCIVINDFDADGKPDVAVTNYGSNTISIFHNTSVAGSISFDPKIDIVTGTNPYLMEAGDFDGDGNAEIVVANFGAGAIVSVFQNTSVPGTISFNTKVDFTVPNGPMGIAISDIDGDGKIDFAVNNFTSNSVSIFKNISSGPGISTGSFDARIDISTGNGPRNLSIADINADSKPELFTANSGSNTISVLSDASLILPLYWLSFTAQKQKECVLLKWTTASEQFTKDFDVQHSTDGINWRSIGRVPVAGNNIAVKAYSFTQTTPAKGINYYRLLESDINEWIEYSDIIHVQFNITDPGPLVYPNPCKDLLTIYTETALKNASITIYSYSGRLILQKVHISGNKNSFDLSNQPAGIYVLNITEEGKTDRIKVLKQ